MAPPNSIPPSFAFGPLQTSATELSFAFRNKSLSIVDVLQSRFAHILKSNPQLNALTSVQAESALLRARELENRTAAPHEILFGVPVVLKENIQKIGFPVECGSKILKGYQGQFNATVVQQLEHAGAIIIATANMDEFAMGSSNEHSAHGPVQNPHDLTRVSGGSSGGSAVACAAGFAPLALGSDTGGSVRQPAAYCGIYGFKPTYGRVSRSGLVAYGSSLDQISPFARTVADLDVFMQVVGLPDPQDATTLTSTYQSQLETGCLTGKRIGVVRSLLKTGVDQNVLKKFNIVEQSLKALGAEFFDINIEGLEHSLSVYYLIASAEASSNLARFDGVRYGTRASNARELNDLYCKSRSEGFGEEVKLRILLGTFALSAGYYEAFYGRAQSAREHISNQFYGHFKNLDFIFMPTAPTSAFKFGEHATSPVQMYLNDIFTLPANLAGLCALSVPAMVAPGELPVGLQFLADKGNDAQLLAFANALEKAGLCGVTPLS